MSFILPSLVVTLRLVVRILTVKVERLREVVLLLDVALCSGVFLHIFGPFYLMLTVKRGRVLAVHRFGLWSEVDLEQALDGLGPPHR